MLGDGSLHPPGAGLRPCAVLSPQAGGLGKVCGLWSQTDRAESWIAHSRLCDLEWVPDVLNLSSPSVRKGRRKLLVARRGEQDARRGSGAGSRSSVKRSVLSSPCRFPYFWPERVYFKLVPEADFNRKWARSPLGSFPPIGLYLEWDFLIVNNSLSDHIKYLLLDLAFRSLDYIGDDFKWRL